MGLERQEGYELDKKRLYLSAPPFTPGTTGTDGSEGSSRECGLLKWNAWNAEAP